ncbi:hypothetical protein VTJ49DRAFT_2090 [Mycothermus thermophilus]|uniref:Probable cytosolic iron-sulfur protein assembly protein 1 n=1 Tax=Humicola insolens TaxID=85995 RepID=A0ABR3VAP0_HUMIN
MATPSTEAPTADPQGPSAATSALRPPQQPHTATITPLPPFQPDLYHRAWSSIPHPSLPLLATAHAKSVTVFSLSTFTKHSALTGGHARSVRTVAWQPPRGSNKKRLGLVTGSFDATAGLWSYDVEGEREGALEREVRLRDNDSDGDSPEDDREWEFNLVLEGHENEIKSLSFSPGGQFLATCSRDKSVWIWEDVSPSDEDDDDANGDWETVAVLNEHEGDVKCVAWCPSRLPGARALAARRRYYSAECLASASYDNTVRIWREDAADGGEWTCVAVLEGHEGTVWQVQWEEAEQRRGKKFPRLMTCSADGTIRVWSLKQDEDDEAEEGDQEEGGFNNNPFRGIPNTMRRSLREEWECTAVLPQVHTRDVYSIAWSAETGLVASTGSDGVIALYAEEEAEEEEGKDGENETAGSSPPKTTWRVLGTVTGGHGPYEINHITWCKRFDPGAGEGRGKEEMLVTTGDDGVVRPWQVRIS